MLRRLWRKSCMKAENSLYFFIVKDHSKPDSSNNDSDKRKGEIDEVIKKCVVYLRSANTKKYSKEYQGYSSQTFIIHR